MSAPNRYRPPGGIRLGHALLILSVGMLTFAARLPSLRREGYERRLSDARAAVSALRGASERFRAREGRWPESGAPGVSPGELLFELPRRYDARGDGYLMQWSRWQRLLHDTTGVSGATTGALRPPSRPDLRVGEVGAITVVSRDTTLLAALLAEHGRDRSFVSDTTWTLLLGPPER